VSLGGKSFGAGNMAQALQHLPYKCKAPSSNPSSTKKKKKVFYKSQSALEEGQYRKVFKHTAFQARESGFESSFCHLLAHELKAS
jgi:hypothetical protein